MRLFAAIPLPEDIQTDLAAVCTGLAGIRWVSEEQLHLTLHFLGDECDAEEIEQALEGIESAPFPVEINGLGRFLHNRGGAIWAGVTASTALADLHAQIGGRLRNTSAKLEKRPFRPHITLGRIKNASESRIQDYLQFHSVKAEFAAESFCLFESRLRPDGPVHIVRREYEFT